MFKIVVVGASGYAGGELLRLVSNHPRLELVAAIANSLAGERISTVFPNLDMGEDRFDDISVLSMDNFDAVIFALPHGESSSLIELVPPDKYIVDLGADFRLKDAAEWEKFYSGSHRGHLTYGLADIPDNQKEIAQQKRVANPGCYATAINLSLAPFITNSVIDEQRINVVAASGTSGAGRKASVTLLTAENMNNISAYKVGGVHQHIAEVQQYLSVAANKVVKVGFTPLLAPMPRGILAVTTAPLLRDYSLLELRETFSSFYGSNPFIKLLDGDQQPQTKAVLGTNNAHFQLAVDLNLNQLIVTAAIDNLVKGAAGQAIQNLNLMLGMQHSEGLISTGIFP